jgi:hypothetical protein
MRDRVGYSNERILSPIPKVYKDVLPTKKKLNLRSYLLFKYFIKKNKRLFY